MIGDVDGFMLHMRTISNSNSGAIVIHVEVPTRIGTQTQDPNPVAMLWGDANSSSFSTGSTTLGYSGGVAMVGQDGVFRKYRTLCRSLMGDGASGYVFGTNMTNPIYGFNPLQNGIMTSGGLLCSIGQVGQYSYARARLRNVRFTGAFVPPYHRIGNSGEWLHITNGVLWPWDNTILPLNLMQNGF